MDDDDLEDYEPKVFKQGTITAAVKNVLAEELQNLCDRFGANIEEEEDDSDEIDS